MKTFECIFVLEDGEDTRLIDDGEFFSVSSAEAHGLMLANVEYKPVTVYFRIAVCEPDDDKED